MRPDDEKRSSYEGSNFIARAKHIDDEKLSSQLMIFLPTEAHRSLSDLTNGQP
jgi:hypothetical protein